MTAVEKTASYGCLTRMHVVTRLAPRLKGEDQSKDIDFSRSGPAARWDAGRADARKMIAAAPWLDPLSPLHGFYPHEYRAAALPET